MVIYGHWSNMTILLHAFIPPPSVSFIKIYIKYQFVRLIAVEPGQPGTKLESMILDSLNFFDNSWGGEFPSYINACVMSLLRGGFS